jgi:hypothetical protein
MYTHRRLVRRKKRIEKEREAEKEEGKKERSHSSTKYVYRGQSSHASE